MTDTKHPDALRQADRIKSSGQFTNLGELDAAAAELHCLHAENVALQQGYDAARLEIDYLRGVAKSKLLAQPVAWLVYLPSIDTQHVYDSQDDIGYLDDLTNHADAEVIPLYPGTAPKAEVAPAGEYPAGAIANGRTHIDRLESHYRFDCEAGPLSNCGDWHGLKRCFEHLADCASRGQAPAPAAVAGPVDDLAELSLLNRLIDLGNKAAGAHAASNSDDGHKGTAAYVQWQELRSQMGDLIRAAYAAPTTQAADSVLEDAAR